MFMLRCVRIGLRGRTAGFEAMAMRIFVGLVFVAWVQASTPVQAGIGGANVLVGNYNGFFKHSDPATPPSPCTLDISSPNNRRFTATLTITFGTDAPIAFVGKGTVSAGGKVSIIAKDGLDMIDVKVDAATFDGGAATLDGTGKLHRRKAPDLDGTFILLRTFDFDPQNPPPSLDGFLYRGLRFGDDGTTGPVTVQLNQSPESNTLIGQGAFGLSSPPPAANAPQDAGDPPLTWSILGTVSNAGDVLWIAQTAEHRLQTILHFPDLSDPGFELFGTYTLHSFTAETGALKTCACSGRNRWHIVVIAPNDPTNLGRCDPGCPSTPVP